MVLFSSLAILAFSMNFVPLIQAEVPDDPNHENPISLNDRPAIEVVFLLDSTGSMADEILSVKSHIQNIVTETISGTPQPVVSIGIVTYRDHPPEDRSYVYEQYDLTRDIDGLMDVLRDIDAKGGGDGPEAVADGLHAAVNEMDWSDNAKKIIILIGDAPPHATGNNGDSSFVQGCPDGYDYQEEVERADALDITIHTIGCSGIEDYDNGVDVFREIALKTGGDYQHLKYQRMSADVYYKTERVAREYADVSRDSTYDPETGTVLVNNLKSFAGYAMKSAAMEAGVRYAGDGEITDGNVENTRNEGQIPDISAPSLITVLTATASALFIIRRQGRV